MIPVEGPGGGTHLTASRPLGRLALLDSPRPNTPHRGVRSSSPSIHPPRLPRVVPFPPSSLGALARAGGMQSPGPRPWISLN